MLVINRQKHQNLMMYQKKISYFQTLIFYYYLKLLKSKKMGCVESNIPPKNPSIKSIKNFDTGDSVLVSSKLIGTATTINTSGSLTSLKLIGERRQDLSISDYDGFLRQSQKEGRTDYPANFKFIKIKSISDDDLCKMRKIDVDPLRCTRTQLAGLAADIILDNSFAKSKFNPEHIVNLTMEIADRYNSVSYHNFSHGFALMQMLYRCFKTDSRLHQTYTDEELTYYLIAGLGHDLNHNGTNNAYETKMNTELAKIANNDAVLQRMHLRTLNQICLSKPEYDVLSKSSNPQALKQKVARAILGTDMAKHFKCLEKLSELRKDNKLNFKQDQMKTKFMQSLFHGCDISTSLLPNEQYMNWVCLLGYEFNQQTKLQAKNNVAVTQFLKFKGIVPFCDGEVGFLTTFVVPLWKQITTSFSGLNKLFENTEKNIASIKAIKQKQSK